MSIWQRSRKVEAVSAIEPISASSAASICHTTSITSDPYNTWVARRQSAITAALARQRLEPFVQNDDGPQCLPAAGSDAGIAPAHSTQAGDGSSGDQQRMSGESERIGKGNWDERSAFGRHVGYL